MTALIAVLLLALLIFGVASGMQSFASAKQAQATIEVAKVAQVNAWGNLLTILILTLIVVALVALVAAAIWFLLRRRNERAVAIQRSYPRQRSAPGPAADAPQIDINMLIQLKALEMMSSMGKPAQTPQALPAPEDADKTISVDEPFHWLRG